MGKYSKNLRSIVERVIEQGKTFDVASGVFKLSPELQELCLLIIYQFVQAHFEEFPLRCEKNSNSETIFIFFLVNNMN